jgi:hypothetical protein
VWDLEVKFPGVNRDLVYVSFEVGKPQSLVYQHNGLPRNVSEFYQELDYIPFQKIFKRTNLGSVPCESIFLSIRDEPLDFFMRRIEALFTARPKESCILDFLNYKGQLHLKSLNKDSKKEVIVRYVNEIISLPGFDMALFGDRNNYKPIQHRNEQRWYFRHPFLKKASFVYELNRNPCPSFYFPGNPNKGSTDYFGYASFDCNRNSSPGANRTVPLDGVEDNLREEFREWWDRNCGLEYKYVFEYILHISRSEWYKNLKKTCQRFYFGIPKDFDVGFLKDISSNPQ